MSKVIEADVSKNRKSKALNYVVLKYARNRYFKISKTISKINISYTLPNKLFKQQKIMGKE